MQILVSAKAGKTRMEAQKLMSDIYISSSMCFVFTWNISRTYCSGSRTVLHFWQYVLWLNYKKSREIAVRTVVELKKEYCPMCFITTKKYLQLFRIVPAQLVLNINLVQEGGDLLET